MAFEGSDIQELGWQEILDLQQPKAHDEIDSLMNQPTEININNIEGIDSEFLMDLITGLSGGGIGGAIKTGTKALFDLSKSTLLKRFFKKYSGKSSPRKPVTSQKGWDSGFLDDLLERPGFGNFKGGADYMVERSGHLYKKLIGK